MIKKDKVKTERRKRQWGMGESVWREKMIIIFSFFAYFSDLWKLDRRFSSEQNAKLDCATRATRRYHYLSILSNFKR